MGPTADMRRSPKTGSFCKEKYECSQRVKKQKDAWPDLDKAAKELGL